MGWIRSGCFCIALLVAVTRNLSASASFLVDDSRMAFSLDALYRTQGETAEYGLRSGLYSKHMVGFGIGCSRLNGAGNEEGLEYGVYLSIDTPIRILSRHANLAIEPASELSATRKSSEQYRIQHSYTLSNSVTVELAVIPGSQQGFRWAPHLGILMVHEQHRVDFLFFGKREQTKDLDAFASVGVRMCSGSSSGSMLVVDPRLALGGSDSKASLTISYLAAIPRQQRKKPYVRPSRWKTD